MSAPEERPPGWIQKQVGLWIILGAILLPILGGMRFGESAANIDLTIIGWVLLVVGIGVYIWGVIVRRRFP